MNDFNSAYKKTMRFEEGYSNNPNDRGGETYFGISRRKHPGWRGWVIIDNPDKHDPRILKMLVYHFYYTEYWQKINCDKIQNQKIAEELFDSAVNFGRTAASYMLQKSLNLLNRNSKDYNDISVDGIVGDETITTVTKCIKGNKENLLFNLMNFYQAKKYLEIMEADSTQEIFTGWFKRVEVIKL